MLTHVFPRRKDVDIYAIDSCQGGGWRVYGDGGQVPIGLWPELDYEGEAISDMHGKTLFVYTDGINEAENIHKEQFGDERLQIWAMPVRPQRLSTKLSRTSWAMLNAATT